LPSGGCPPSAAASCCLCASGPQPAYGPGPASGMMIRPPAGGGYRRTGCAGVQG
jgi:hypothetical protein